MVTQHREPLLINHIALLRDAFKRSRVRYAYTIEAIVILPDHLHMIITPKKAKEYSNIVSHIKRSFVYGLDDHIKEKSKMRLGNAKYKRKHAGIWQERFYEHTIRNEKDLLEKMTYIQNNPVKHDLVQHFNDWPYSSFVKMSG
jgi:putative transposase